MQKNFAEIFIKQNLKCLSPTGTKQYLLTTMYR